MFDIVTKEVMSESRLVLPRSNGDESGADGVLEEVPVWVSEKEEDDDASFGAVWWAKRRCARFSALSVSGYSSR